MRRPTIIAVLSVATCLAGAAAPAAARSDRFLTGPSNDDPARVALAYVREHSAFGLDADDRERLRLSDRYTSLDGVTHLVWKQQTRGVEVYDSFLGANVAADGRLINVTGSPVADLELDTTVPALTARTARALAGGDARAPARLVAFADGDETRLAWRLRVEAPTPHEVVVDAHSGRNLARRSLTAGANSALIYDLYPDQRVTPRSVNLGADPSWIDRSEGGTKLQGNNAHATTFLAFTGDPTEVAQVGSNWAFPVQFFNHTGCPAFGCTFQRTDFNTRLANREQTATQAFYLVNHFHDHLLAPPIGFDEPSRNFEHVNASGEGIGADAINVLTNHTIADGQWVHAADGSAPEMRLGRTNPAFGYPYDVRMSDTAALVYHEYAHGLTSRLIGTGLLCCAGVFGQALAEGWSDWYAMDLLVAEGAVADGPGPGDVRWDEYLNAGGRTEALDCPVGASAAACPGAGTAGTGGYTFGDFSSIIPALPFEEHANGEIWAQTLWDLRTRLGSHTARCLVTGGLRLAPASPRFLEARDAILQHALVVGVPQATVWEVFAARGMGVAATASTTPPDEDFSVPASLPPPPAPSGSCGGGSGSTPPPSGGNGPPPPPGNGDPGRVGPSQAQLAAALAADLGATARALNRLGLRRLVRRRSFTAKGLDALTAGRFALRLTGRGVLAKGQRAVTAAGRYAVTVRLTRRGRRVLRGTRRIKARLILRFTPSAGQTVSRSVTARLKR